MRIQIHINDWRVESWFYLLIDREMIRLQDRNDIPDLEKHMIQSLKLKLTFA
jgi:hypothetical protein